MPRQEAGAPPHARPDLSAAAQSSQAVTTIIPGTLHAVGGVIAATRRLSWIDRDAQGWLPVQCYVLRDGDHVVLIDTGLIVHKHEIQAGLAPLVEGARHRHVMLTRREPDTMMNLPWIVRQFRIQSVRCCGPIDPFDLVERLDEAHTSAQIKAMLGIEVEFVAPGGVIESGRLRLEIIRPTVRILATDWLYESRTKTLFTSDLWSFLTLAAPGAPRVTTPAEDDISVDAVRRHLLAKFDWLQGIDTRPMARNLQEIVGGRDIERICPSYGCIIAGKAGIGRLLARTLDALDALACEPRISVMDDFRWLEKARPALTASSG